MVWGGVPRASVCSTVHWRPYQASVTGPRPGVSDSEGLGVGGAQIFAFLRSPCVTLIILWEPLA